MAGPYGVGPVVFDGAGVSNVTATNSVQLGSRLERDGRLYVYVYNASTNQISPGMGCIVTATSGYSVVFTNATLVGAYVGVVHHATLTTGTYGWIVARGNTQVRACTSTALAKGDLLAPGIDGTHAQAAGTMTANAHGYCTVDTAAAGLGEAYVNCLFG